MNKSPEPLKKSVPMWYGVTNPKWISIKVFYFFAYSAIGSYFPFIVPFYTALGLTTSQIGIIEFLNIFISTIAWPIVGGIADKSGRHSVVLGLFMIGYLIPIASFAFFNPPFTQAQNPVTLRTNTFELEACDLVTAQRLSNTKTLFLTPESNDFARNFTTYQLICKDLRMVPAQNAWGFCWNFTRFFLFIIVSNWSTVLKMKSESNQKNCSVFLLDLESENEKLRSFYQNKSEPSSCNIEFPVEASDNTRTFLLVVMLRSFSAIALEPSMSIADAIAYDMIGPQHRSMWGQQRMFAALAWGMGGGLMGLLADALQSFRVCFLTFAGLTLVAICIAFFWLPKRLSHTSSAKEEAEKVPFFQALRTVLVSPLFCTVCAICLVSGMLLSVTQVTWPQHMGELKAPKLYFGVAAIIIAFFEVPSLFFAGAIINKIGASVCFLLMFLAYTIRYGANAFLTPETVWIALPFESLHLFCFGLFFPAATRTADIIAPRGTSSTVQAFIGACYGGVGTGSGVLLTSIIYETFGRHIAFIIYSAFAFFSFLVLLVLYFAYLRKAMARVAKLSQEKAGKQEDTPASEPLNGNSQDLEL